MAKQQPKAGLWLIGAAGGVGTTAALGLEAIRRMLAPPIGLLGHLPPFTNLKLAPLADWIIGGHEIRRAGLVDAARELHQSSGLFSQDLLRRCTPQLKAWERNLRDGTLQHCGQTIEKMADRPGTKRRRTNRAILDTLIDDIQSFARRHKLRHVVVANVASTEPPFKLGRVHQDWAALARALDQKSSPLPASSLYALAAIEAGASYVNFTPSVGIDVPGLLERASERATSFMGCDGKTGETLMKSVLAPMFAARNLPVLSWVGHNIFGNRDGAVLDDPKHKAAKAKSKDHLVGEMLGYKPKTLVSIEYIESLGDWKTAWDHIHFEGFLGTKMALQFIWQGCDSILAAPLLIEMARFAELAHRRGECGAVRHLACFFKSPMQVKEQGFARQYESLLAYATDD
jgi:myo-inositol-1-phosphate synthase